MGKLVKQQSEQTNNAPTCKSARQRIIDVHNQRNMMCDHINVEFFLDLFETQRKYEQQQQRLNRDGKEYLVDPYAERIGYLTSAYLNQSSNFQQYIQAARQDGIYWRGDDQATFEHVCDQTMRWRDQTQQQRDNTKKRLRGYIHA